MSNPPLWRKVAFLVKMVDASTAGNMSVQPQALSQGLPWLPNTSFPCVPTPHADPGTACPQASPAPWRAVAPTLLGQG